MALQLRNLPLKSQETYTEFVEIRAQDGSVRKHSGLDFVANQGDEVFATHTGLVLKAGNYGAYGNVIVIEDSATGEATLYSNIENISVVEGQQINFGQKIAEVSDSSYIEGAVLHFEVLPQNLTLAIKLNPHSNTLGIESLSPSLRSDPRKVIRQSLPNFTRKIQATRQTVEIEGESQDAERQGNLFLVDGDAQVQINSGDGNDIFAINFSKNSSGQVVIQDPNLDAVFVINGKMIFENRNAVPLRDINGNIIEGRWAIEGGYLLDQEGQDLLISSERNEGNQILIKGFFNSLRQDRFGIKLNQSIEQVQSSSRAFSVPNRLGQNVFPTGRDGSFALIQNKSDGLYVSRYNSRGAKIETQKIGNKQDSQFSSESIATAGQSIIFEDGRIGILFTSNNLNFNPSSFSSKLTLALFENNGKYLGNKVIDERKSTSQILSPSAFYVDKNSGEVFCSYVSGGLSFFNGKVDSSIEQVNFEIQSGQAPIGRSLEVKTYANANLLTKHNIQGTLSGFTIHAPVFKATEESEITNIDLQDGSEYLFSSTEFADNESMIDSINVGQGNHIHIEPVENGVLVIDGFKEDTEIYLTDFFDENIDLRDFILDNSTIHSSSVNYAEDFYGMGTAEIFESSDILGATNRTRRSVDEQDSAPFQYQGLNDEKYVALNLPNNQKIIFASTSPERFLELLENFKQSYVARTSTSTSTSTQNPTSSTSTLTTTLTQTPTSTSTSTQAPTSTSEVTEEQTTKNAATSTSTSTQNPTSSTSTLTSTSSSLTSPPKETTRNSTSTSTSSSPSTSNSTSSNQNPTTQELETTFEDTTQDPTRTSSMLFNLTTGISTIISTTTAALLSLSSTSSQEQEMTTALATTSPSPESQESRAAVSAWIIPVAVLASVSVVGLTIATYLKKKNRNRVGVDLEAAREENADQESQFDDGRWASMPQRGEQIEMDNLPAQEGDESEELQSRRHFRKGEEVASVLETHLPGAVEAIKHAPPIGMSVNPLVDGQSATPVFRAPRSLPPLSETDFRRTSKDATQAQASSMTLPSGQRVPRPRGSALTRYPKRREDSFATQEGIDDETQAQASSMTLPSGQRVRPPTAGALTRHPIRKDNSFFAQEPEMATLPSRKKASAGAAEAQPETSTATTENTTQLSGADELGRGSEI